MSLDVISPARQRWNGFSARWKKSWVEWTVNSAGMNCLLPAEDYGDQEFSQVMELNIHALHRLTREVGRRWMIPGRYGRILNLSSVKSMIGTTENYAAYCASKGAVNMYTRQLACEWGKYGITCNAIAPTFVRTPINSFQLDDAAFISGWGIDPLCGRRPYGYAVKFLWKVESEASIKNRNFGRKQK